MENLGVLAGFLGMVFIFGILIFIFLILLRIFWKNKIVRYVIIIIFSVIFSFLVFIYRINNL